MYKYPWNILAEGIIPGKLSVLLSKVSTWSLTFAISKIATLGPTWEFQLCLKSCNLASWTTKWHDYATGTTHHIDSATEKDYCHTWSNLGISAQLEILQSCKLDHEVAIKCTWDHHIACATLHHIACATHHIACATHPPLAYFLSLLWKLPSWNLVGVLWMFGLCLEGI